MNETHDQPAAAPPTGFFASVRRLGLWRTDDRWIGGVAAGLAHRMGIDPVVVRGLFVVTAIFGGLGLLLYGAAWALLPEASDGRIHLEEAVRGRFDIALVGAIAFFVIGLSNPVFWWDGSVGWSLSWLIAVGAVVGIVALVINQRRPTGPPPGSGPAGAPPAPAPPGAHPPAPDPSETPMTTTGETGPAGTDHDTAATERLDVTDAGTPPDPAAHVTTPLPALPTGTSGAEAASSPAAAGGGTTYDVGGPDPTTGASGPSSHAGQGGWGGWGTGGQYGAAESPQPPQPVHVVPGPGSRVTSAVLALCLLAAAGLTLANHTGVLDGSLWLLAGGTVLALLGLGVVVSGVLGRRQGGLGVLGFLVALVLVPTALVATTVPGLTRIGTDGWNAFGDSSFTPSTVAAAEPGRSLAAGTLRVDLTELDAEEDVTVPVSVGFGNARVVVPQDAGVTVTAEIGAGELVGPLGEEWSVIRDGSGITSSGNGNSIAGGVGVDVVLSRPGTPHITVETEVGFGQIYIEEQP